MKTSDERLEDWADGFSKLGHFGNAEHLGDAVKAVDRLLTMHNSLEAYTRAPPINIDQRERIEAWIREGVIEFSYTAHRHMAHVRIIGTEIIFEEGYEHFASEWMVAQIALALAAGVK